MNILLGSNSPRRNELLRQLGVDFKKVHISCNEDFNNDMPVRDVAEFLALKKSSAYNTLLSNDLLITADTTVVVGNEILNKPRDFQESVSMLKKLEGKQHSVITGVCLRSIDEKESFSIETLVTVGPVSALDVGYYLNNFKPYDKAGSYGIQEWFGLTQVSSIEGCYYNVVGLPCNELYKRLKKYL